jgi:hypothetical protein
MFRLIMFPFKLDANLIVAPLVADARTERSVPDEPSSSGLVTVKVLSTSRPSSPSRMGDSRGRLRVVNRMMSQV